MTANLPKLLFFALALLLSPSHAHAAPSTPSLQSPGSTSSPGTTISDLRPTFSWSASSGATDYGLYIRDMTTNTLVFDDDSMGNITSYRVSSGVLVAGHQYRWNMRARDSSGWSSYSSYRYFQTQASGSPPSAPTISSPGSTSSPGTTITDLRPTFSWSASSGATDYGLYIRDMTTNTLVFDDDSMGNTTSYQVSSGALVAGRQYRWNARAKNAAGWSAYSSYRYFQTQATAVTPSISSVSPTSMPASSSDQTLTIRGSNFVSGATLTFDPPTGSNLTSIPSKLTFVSSSEIRYQINNGNDAGTWRVQVNNPGGQSSGWSNFTVTAVVVTPSISSVSPTSMPASNSDQTLTIRGSNFVSGATLTFDPPTGSNLTSISSKLTFVSSSEIRYQINNGNDAGTWSVRVNNPSGQSSSWSNFTVTAVVVTPSISSVSPTSMPASSSDQTLTIRGSNFVSGATLTFDPPTGSNLTGIPSKLTFVSSSEIRYQINNGNDAGTWSVRVNNPSGQSSGWSNFTVSASPGSFTLRHDIPYWDSRAPAGPAVMLRWDAAAGAASYSVYRDGSKIHPKSGEPAYSGRTYLNNLQLTPGGTHTFYIVAQNAAGSTQSNAVTITMPTAPSGTPQIDKLTPTVVTGVPLPDRVTLNLQGSSFQAGVKAYVSYSGAANQLLDASHVQRLDAENVVVRVATSVDADTWSIYLKNPDNKTSNTKTFQVTAPTGTVSLHQISPPVVSPSAQARVFTLTGSGFSATDRVKLTTPTGSVYVSAPDVQFIGHQTLKFSRSFTQSPQTVTVRVVKSNAAESDPVTLTVNQTLMPNLRVDPASIHVTQTSVPVGGTLDVSYSVQNVGTGPAPMTTTRFRLSTDRRLSSTDPGFENLDWSIDAIPAQQSLTPPSVRLLIPQTLPPGQYYVGLFVDALGEAGQSDETDDAALSLQAITVTATATPEAPRFTLHPKSQNPSAGSGFSLEAQASGALRYVWYFNGKPIQDPLRSPVGKKEILHINFPTAGNAGEYWVEAIGVNGLTARSNTAVIRFINSTPPAPSIEKGAFKLTSLDNAPIRPDWPTVILTHGWQMDYLWEEYFENSTPDFRTLAEKIRSILTTDSQANIMLFAWQGAYRSQPGSAAAYVDYAGMSLATELQNFLGRDYNGKMHFIGHSLGCFVSAVAIQKISDWNLFPDMPTTEGYRKVQLTVLDPAFKSPVPIPFTGDKFSAPGVGWSDCRFQETLKNDRLIAVVENYYANVGWGAGGPISNAGPRFRGTLLTKDELGTNENAHSAVWNTWYRSTIGNDSFELEKGGFNNSIILEDHRSQTGWNWLHDRYPWAAERSCIHEPSDLQTMKIGIIDAADVVGDLTKDGFNLMVDKLSGAFQESQDQLHGILTKTTDLIASPFQQQAQQHQFAAKSMSSVVTTGTAPEGLRLKSVLTIPAQAERIRILAKRTDTATDGVLAVLFAGVPLQVLGTDYFSDTAFRELTLPIRHLRNRTGELELVLKRESGEEISLRIGSIEIENQSDVVAASSSLVVTKPAKNLRTLSSRTLCQGQWKGKVPLQALTLRVNQGAAIPLTVEADGTWQFEADGLLPGNNQLRFDATTIHGQTLSASREVWRIVQANFQLAVQGEGLVKGAKLGTSRLEVGQELRLSTTPKTGHIFERWSGVHNGNSRTLHLRVASGMSLTAHFIPSPFIGHEGTYMDHTESATPLHSAMISAVITQAGSVTLTLVHQGHTYRATGLFGANGLLSLYFNRTGQPPLSLHLAMEFATGELTGTLKEGAEDIGTVGAIRSPWTTRAPTTLPPRYTLVFDQPTAPLPPAYGYGTLTLTPAGAITWTGKLPDGSAVTQGSRLLSDNTWIMQVSTHRGKGWAGGTVGLESAIVAEPVSGQIAWNKPATTGGFLPESFSGTLNVFGGVFQDLSRSSAPLFPGLPMQPDQMQMEWGSGLFASPASTLLTLNPRRQFIFPTAENSAGLNLQTGLLSGRLRNSNESTLVSYQAVIVPGHTSAYGQFSTKTSTGAVLLKPAPGVTPLHTRFFDSFDDNRLDATLWQIEGARTIERNGRIELRQAMNDDVLQTKPFSIASTGKLIIERRLWVRFAGSYSLLTMEFEIGQLPVAGISYAEYGPPGETQMERRGFFVTRNVAATTAISDAKDVSSAITPAWGRWIDERVEYDPSSGALEYFIDGTSQLVFNIGRLPASLEPAMSLRFTTWGDVNGQEQFFDNLKVTQEP